MNNSILNQLQGDDATVTATANAVAEAMAGCSGYVSESILFFDRHCKTLYFPNHPMLFPFCNEQGRDPWTSSFAKHASKISVDHKCGLPVLQDAEAVAKAMASAAVKVKCDGKVTGKGALCLNLISAFS